MDRERVRQRRLAELEEKRRKLEALKQRKKNLIEKGAPPAEETSKASLVDATKAPRVDGHTNKPAEEEFDDFLKNLLDKSSEPEPADSSQGDTEVKEKPSTDDFAEKVSALSVVECIVGITISPTRLERYDKHTQTESQCCQTFENEIGAPDDEKHRSETDSPRSVAEGDLDNTEINKVSKSVLNTSTEGSEKKSGEGVGANEVSFVEMDPSEREKYMATEEFEAFITKSSRLLNRVLAQSENFDVLVDYGGDSDEDTEDRQLALQRQGEFFYEKLTEGRTITSVDWSPFHKELLLVAYSERADKDSPGFSVSGKSNGQMTNESDGLVLLWSTVFGSREPEYSFTCQSPVTTAVFHPFDKHLVLGGTYSGQVVIWDTRAKAAPVQRSSLTTLGHTHPVYSLVVLGTKNAHSLMSTSNDGRLCVWSLSNLSKPSESLTLKYSNGKKEVPIAITCMASWRNRGAELLVGAENGSVYSAQIHHSSVASSGPSSNSASNSSKRADGSRASVQWETPSSGPRSLLCSPILCGHVAPITSIHLDCASGAELGTGGSSRDRLCLSTSLDWTCHLWSLEAPEKPLFTFNHARDYLYDVAWSPVHPALFVTVDGSGILDLWNINIDTETPARTLSASEHAINRVSWDQEGRRLAFGDSSGRAFVFELSSEIALPDADEDLRLQRKLLLSGS